MRSGLWMTAFVLSAHADINISVRGMITILIAASFFFIFDIIECFKKL